jgi:1-pyrroline-5-carboxylate dehydrogenase
LPVSM